MTTTDNLSLTEMENGQANGYVTFNEAVRKLDATVQLAVESFLATSPGSPSEGDRHIMSGTGGAWSGFTAWNIAWYTNGAWQEIVAREGFCAYTKDTMCFYCFDGSFWYAGRAEDAMSGAGTVQGDATQVGRGISVFTTVASGTGAVLMAAEAGIEVTIVNAGANALLIYPAAGASDKIDGGSVDAAISLPAGQVARLVCANSTDWWSLIA